MGKIKKQRAQILKPNKRVPIAHIGGINKIAVRSKGGSVNALLASIRSFKRDTRIK